MNLELRIFSIILSIERLFRIAGYSEWRTRNEEAYMAYHLKRRLTAMSKEVPCFKCQAEITPDGDVCISVDQAIYDSDEFRASRRKNFGRGSFDMREFFITESSLYKVENPVVIID